METIANWNYDKIIAMLEKQSLNVTKDLKKAAVEKRKYIGKLRRQIRESSLEWKIINMRNWEKCIETMKSDLIRNVEPKVNSRLTDLSKSHPFLIGPATMDSLLKRPPDRLDYIQEGKFPFDNTYFEFMEPLKLTHLGDLFEGELCGVQLRNQGNTDILPLEGNIGSFGISGFIDSPNKGYVIIDSEIMVEGQRVIYGLVHIPRTLERISFDNKSISDSGSMTSNDNLSYTLRIETMPFQELVIDEEFIKKIGTVKTVKEVEALEYPHGKELLKGLQQLNKLGINLINYINAHNVYIKEHKRVVKKRIIKNGKSRTPIHEAQQLFHIVAVDDKTIDIDERDPNASNSLEWRVYVRGHNRKYRDSNRDISSVTWVRPYVKGPEDAPWKHHRYAALAGMLKREREMLSKYLPRKNQ